MTTPRWTPRTPHEALIVADTILAPIVPTITQVRQRIADMVPVGGQPAGNGNPGGGSHSISSPTERTALGTLPPELRDLDLLDQLAASIAKQATDILDNLTPNNHFTNATGSPARQLAWARWCIRQCINHTPKKLDVRNLTRNVYDLEHLINRWTTQPTKPSIERSLGLAADDTELWCRSCLRAGHREPRSDRYRDGVCRWCGRFHAEHNQYPPLSILDTRHAGQRITVTMINEALTPSKKKRRKR